MTSESPLDSPLGSSFHKMKIIHYVSPRVVYRALISHRPVILLLLGKIRPDSTQATTIYIFLLLEIVDPGVDHLLPTRRDIPPEINITVNQVMSLSPVIMESSSSSTEISHQQLGQSEVRTSVPKV